MKSLFFTKRDPLKVLLHKDRRILNFFNFHNIWWFFNNSIIQNLVSQRHNLIFADSVNIARLKRIKVNRGPIFTKTFLLSRKAKKEKHFFINLREEDKILLSKKTSISIKNIYSAEMPFINNIEFPEKEVKILAEKIKSSKANFVWNFIASPKQEILSNQLFYLTKARFFFNVGAAGDFLLKRKKEAPDWIRRAGFEWFFRFVTDFKYSRKKVLRSLIALKYINRIGVSK